MGYVRAFQLRSGIKAVLYATALFLLSAAAYGQQSTISGTVKSSDNQTIPYAHISIPAAKQNATGDEWGKFSITSIAPGIYDITITSIGYEPTVFTVEMVAGRNHRKTFVLTEAVAELDMVTIHAKSDVAETTEQPYAVTALTTKSFVNRAVDVNQILGQSPGIRIRAQGGVGSRFEFSLNGLSGRQVKMFIDGVPMEYLGDAFQLNNVPANLVRQVEVYKGVVPIELGSDALGGAVNIVTDVFGKPFIDASYSIGSFGTHRAALSTLHRSKSGFLVRLNGFMNHSDNNYIMNDMEVYDYAQQQFVRKDIRRFHDMYQSQMGQAEFGFIHKKWADLLMFGVTLTKLDQEIQNGIFATPVGEATVAEKSHQFNVRYQNSTWLAGRMNTNLYGQYNRMSSVSVDTSSNRYNWEGRIIRTEDNALGELVREKMIFDYDQSLFLLRGGASYSFLRDHEVKANVVATHLSRKGSNRLNKGDSDPFSNPNSLGKLVAGVSVQSNWFHEKLATIVSAKYFAFDMLTRNAVLDQSGKTNIEDVASRQGKPGFAVAARYQITRDLMLKASGEKANRLPEARESLGDGYRIIAAPLLKPENSMNVNAGFLFKKDFNSNTLTVESNFFNRNVRNWIFLQSQGMLSQHVNVMKVLARGFESDIRYSYKNRVGLYANVTYQNVMNNEKYVAGSKVENRFYRDRLSNTPYFFGNTGIDYKLKASNRINLSLYYSASYVHNFYLVYSRASQNNSKNSIPSQFINNAGITASSDNNRYNITFEVRNFLNERAYDNFRVQNPGRAFNVKVRYFIQKLT